MLNAKSILSLSIFIIFKLIYTVSTFSRTRQGNTTIIAKKSILKFPFSTRVFFLPAHARIFPWARKNQSGYRDGNNDT